MRHASQYLILITSGLVLSLPAMAQQGERARSGETGRRPLNLSLPRDAVFPPAAMVRSDPRLDKNVSKDPEIERLREQERQRTEAMLREREQRSAGHPYGTGFEARQRGMSTDGMAGGAGGGMGGGSAGGSGGRGR